MSNLTVYIPVGLKRISGKGTDVIFDDSCNVPIVDDVMDIGRAFFISFY